MTIPFFDLAAVNAPHRDAIDRSIAAVLNSGQTILGPQLEAFEKEFAQACGVTHVVGVANGLDALSLIIRASGFGAGDEIIVPANTYIATLLAVSANGCVPVLAEPHPETMLIDPVHVQALITSKTRAIIAVHLYGLLCDMDALSRIAHEHGLRLFEDAAQAHGARRGGRVAGGFADAAGFSFYPTKNLGALGDGGAVTTDDDVLAEKVRMLRNYGSVTKNVHDVIGVNSRLDELQAAILRVKLPSLDAENSRRREIAQAYGRCLSGAGLTLPVAGGEDHVHHQYVIRSRDRDRVRSALEAGGIGTGVHYPTPPHRQPAYRGIDVSALPITERLAGEVLSLPIHPALRDAEVEHVVEVLNAFA